MKLYFDFDGTLFNTALFYENFVNLLKDYGVSESLVVDVRKKLFTMSIFSVNKLVSKIVGDNNLDESIYKKVDDLYKNNYVYEDCVSFLKKVSGKFELILLTYGDMEYQKKKIECSGLSSYFNKIIITEKNKALEDVDYERGIFIDNSVKELNDFKSCGAKYLFRIKRMNDSHYNDEGIYDEVDSLDDKFYEKLINIKNEFD